jgi:cystathionine beta-lyase
MSMGIGYALSEQLLWDEKTGKPLNNNLLDYKLSSFMDHPRLQAAFVENPEPTSPFGTKALGEPPACPVAPAIRAALQARLDHGIFGYDDLTEAWYQAYIGWWRDRHGLTMERENLIFSAGVVATLSSLVRKLTTPNENVVIQTPVYNIFVNSIVNNGARVLESPLVYDGETWSVDFADLETKLADPQTSLMILCNPHNPVGRIWSREELARIGALCKKHHVTVISDEIHCDLTEPGKAYVPFASVDEVCRDLSIT